MGNNIFENEQWWQENGSWWADEVWERRKRQPLYGIQEVVLSSYFSKIPDSKVLEFGVGFGRHVEYLDQLNNITVYGVDQSPTMLQSLKERLKDNKQLIDRMVQIEPRQRLPFPDNYFDVVYTVSVLIHIQPEHIKEILSELIRVSKHRIVHVENNYVEDAIMTAPDHNGCWGHPLVHYYKELGFMTEVWEKGADFQDFYMVRLSDDINFENKNSSVTMNRLRLIDQRIRPQVEMLENELSARTTKLGEQQAEVSTLKAQLNQQLDLNQKLSQQLDLQQNQNQQLHQQINALLVENNEVLKALDNSEKSAVAGKLEYENLIGELNQNLNEKRTLLKELESTVYNSKVTINSYEETLNEIYNSLGWKVLRRVRHNRPLSLLVKPIKKSLVAAYKIKKKQRINEVIPVNATVIKEPIYITEFRDRINALPEGNVVAIHHPDWIGVTNSTKDIFKRTISLREIHGDDDVKYIANILFNSNNHTYVFSGLAIGYSSIMRKIKELQPDSKILLFWHGNTTQMYEDYSWLRHSEIIELCKTGIIDTWGFAKKNLAELYSKIGINAKFVMNYIPPKKDLWLEKPKTKRIGLYSSGNYWNKNAFTQVASMRLVDNVFLYATPCNERIHQFADQLGVNLIGKNVTIRREDLLEEMRKNLINMYVTFTECSPLVPLESLSLGVPCLTGPNHHYFKGTALEEYLVVNYPDDPVEIANKLELAIKDRDIILNLYLQWVENYNKEAQKSIEDFIGV